jgi:uncharacterized protein YeaC (DUF1315 family)
MKLTKAKLKQIIREELEKLSIEEGSMGTHPAGQKLADKQQRCKQAVALYEEGRSEVQVRGSAMDGVAKMGMAEDIMRLYGCKDK